MELTIIEKATALHQRILANGNIAAQALVDFSKALKQMRDEKLYTCLGYERFETYCEESVGLKQRQAYSYIQVIENLGEEFLRSSAKVGIKKLEILARLPQEDREEFIATNPVDEMTTRQLQQAIKDKKELEIKLLAAENKPSNTIDNTDYKAIESIKAEKRALELKLYTLQQSSKPQSQPTTRIEYKDSSSTLAEIERLKKEIAEKEVYVTKYKDTLNELHEKNELVGKFMGESTNFQLILKTSENTLKMMNFVKDMAKYDYLSETFNEIPEATRKEYVRSIYGVYKWAKNILNVVKHDDVIGINKNIIDVNEIYTDIE